MIFIQQNAFEFVNSRLQNIGQFVDTVMRKWESSVMCIEPGLTEVKHFDIIMLS